MANSYFSFKQFTVYHNLCAMKVGIDGVLLGAWATVIQTESILDIGTGTGLIALMLAQRSSAQIDVIDIDNNAVQQANENIANSPWSNRIHSEKISLQLFAEKTMKRYDLIVSNSPFFINSTKTPSEVRTTARHTDTLTHEELIINALRLLKPTGRICIILPVNEGFRCLGFALKIGFHCTKKCTVFPKPNSAAKRLLLELSVQPSAEIESELTIESNERHHYSPEFTLLAKDFYLKL